MAASISVLPVFCEGKRILADLSTGDYWRKTEEKEADRLRRRGGVQGYLNPLIIFSDGADMDKARRMHGEVVMVACGNFRNHILRKTCARELLALIPSIPASNVQRNDERLKRAKKKVFHACMSVLNGCITVSKCVYGIGYGVSYWV